MKLSDCCGVPAYSNGDLDTEDIGICPECKEHCEYIEEEEEPKLPLDPKTPQPYQYDGVAVTGTYDGDALPNSQPIKTNNKNG
jgi:hypothetical protein